jgi:general stress protein 26
MSRPMTNLNEDPYSKMWFPTYSTTRKVKEIERNQNVVISFPSYMEGRFWEIEGWQSLRWLRMSRPSGGDST